MKSSYGDRDTVGTQYIKAQGNSTQGLVLADIGTEMCRGLVDDINEVIGTNPFQGKDFYINIVEERDLQMKNALKRRMFVTKYRPYPEDNTLVFKIIPKESRILYCWDVPHHSELPNILSNEYLYGQEYIQRLKEWLKNDLSNFGFIKVNMNSSQVEGYEESQINTYRQAYYNMLKSRGMDDKSLSVEKHWGYFWIPNKFHKDQDLEKPQPKSSLIF